MATLLDVPAFAPLGCLCNRFGVEFKLFGGALARLIELTQGLAPTAGNVREVDLFTLAPGFADLDISHSGPPELTNEIMRTVLDEIPNAECVRWQLRSDAAWAIYRTAEYFNNRVPTRLMSLSTDPRVGFKDPFNGTDDIKQGNYRYERNSAYAGSPLYKQGLDLELFSGLIYLRALFESSLSLDVGKQPGLAAVAQVMKQAQGLPTIMALQESAYLRSRFYYLLAAAAAAKPVEVTTILQTSGVRPLLDYITSLDQVLGTRLGRAVDGPKTEGETAISAARLGGDIYRAPDITAPWVKESDARDAMQAVLNSKQRNDTLGDGEDVVWASPPIRIASGISPSSVPTSVASGEARLVQEFMYFNLGVSNFQQNGRWRLFAGANRYYAEEDLAVLLATSRSGAEREWTVHSLPCAITLRRSNVLVGVNGWGLFEQLSLVPEPEIRIFLAGWRNE